MIAKSEPGTNSARRLPATIIGSLLVIGTVLAVLAGIAFAKTRQIEAAMSQPPPPEMPVAVSLATATGMEFRQSTVVVGTVLASESIVLQTELTGLVTEVMVDPGDTVKRGDVLVRMDDRTEQALLQSAIASRDLAQAELERNRRLIRANAGSVADMDVAEARLLQADAVVSELKVRVDRKILKAPFDARVGLFDLHPGQYLVEGSRVTTLSGIADFFHVDFAMPAHVADSIRIGDNVELRISDSDEPYSASIIAVDATADRISRSLMARARLPNPPAILQPNDSVRVTIYYGDMIPAVEVPATTVRRSPTGTLVYVVETVDGVQRCRSVPVVVAGNAGAMVRIIKGVSQGQNVVADGSFKVTDGAMIAGATITGEDDLSVDQMDVDQMDSARDANGWEVQ